MIIIVGFYSIALLLIVCAGYEGEGREITSRGTEHERPAGKSFKVR